MYLRERLFRAVTEIFVSEYGGRIPRGKVFIPAAYMKGGKPEIRACIFPDQTDFPVDVFQIMLIHGLQQNSFRVFIAIL